MRHYINLVEELLLEFDIDSFLNRVRSVMALVRRGGTPGERDAAKHAFDRMIARATLEIKRMREPGSGVTREQIDRFMRALEIIGSETKESPKTERPKPPPPKMPRFSVGQWVVHVDNGWVGKIAIVRNFGAQQTIIYTVHWLDAKNASVHENELRRATQDEIDAALAQRAKTSTRSESGASFDIKMMARYISPEENSNKVYGVVKKLDTGKVYTFWGGWMKALKVKHFPDEADASHQFRLKLRKGYDEITPGTETEAWVMKALKVEFARIGE
jgi:hypothetical protein